MESRKKQALAVGLFTGLLTILTQVVPAQADVILTIQENAGGVNTTTVIGSPLGAGTNATTSFATAHYTVSILNGLEQQGADLTKLLSSTILITKNGNSSDVLHITITGTGYTAPVAPPDVNVLSSVSDTSTYGGARPLNTLNFQSTVGGTALGIQSPAIIATGSTSDNKNTVLSTLSAPFSIVQALDLVLTNNGDQLSFGGNTTLSQVPTPASVVLGLIGMAPLAWRRRSA